MSPGKNPRVRELDDNRLVRAIQSPARLPISDEEEERSTRLSSSRPQNQSSGHRIDNSCGALKWSTSPRVERVSCSRGVADLVVDERLIAKSSPERLIVALEVQPRATLPRYGLLGWDCPMYRTLQRLELNFEEVYGKRLFLFILCLYLWVEVFCVASCLPST